MTDATATFTGVRRDAAYTFTLTADGLDAPITLELPANAPTVTSFTTGRQRRRSHPGPVGV